MVESVLFCTFFGDLSRVMRGEKSMPLLSGGGENGIILVRIIIIYFKKSFQLRKGKNYE